MIKRTRLSGFGTNSMRAEKRLKPVNYKLTVTMVSPDHVEIDLWKDGKFVETIMGVDPADLEESAFDVQGRILPSVVWGTLQTAKQYMLETKNIVPSLPNKHDVYDADYFDERHPHPYVKT